MRNTFSILFYINRQKQKGGKSPLMGRITVNGTVAYFSCQSWVEQKIWSAADNRATGKTPQAIEINKNIDNYKSRIIHCYNKLLLQGKAPLTARAVKNEFTGMGNEYTTLLQHIEKDIQTFKERVNKDRSEKTLSKMKIVKGHIATFIKKKYRSNDIYIQELTIDFIKEFSNWLLYTKNLCQSTVWVYTTYLKKILLNAHQQGEIQSNPFHKFRIAPNVKQREFLTEEEIKKIMWHNGSKTVGITKEIFLFSCFTGISFADIRNLTLSNIYVIKNKTWVVSRRQKSNIPFQLQLLPIPQQILTKAIGRKKDPSRPVFKTKSYECTNRDLKILKKECGINKQLTFHIARHTFATLALSNGMPIESVSRILGHTNITTTQIYAKITNSKLSNDFSQLEQNLKSILDTKKV